MREWRQGRNSVTGLYSELVRRMSLVTEEVRHMETNWMHVFSSTFAFASVPSILVVAVVGFALFVCYTLNEHYENFSHLGFAIMFALNCSLVALLVSRIGGREPSTGPGVTLALNYYLDRLKLVFQDLNNRLQNGNSVIR